MELNFKTSIVKLTETIWAIDQEMMRNYVILGTEKALVIDFGVCPCDFLSLVRQITDLPLVAVLTHSDGDHTANLGAFAEVYVHPVEIPLLQNAPCRLVPLEDDTEIDIGGRVLRVLHLPGHTPGSIALLDAAAGDLFSGDTVSNATVYLFGPMRCVTDYHNSLLKLSERSGCIRNVWPAHGPAPVSPDAIGKLLALTESLMMGEATGTPHDEPHIPAKVKRYALEDCSFYF